MNILIVGCGDVGSRLGKRLVNVGYQVWGLRRDTGKLESSIHGISADLVETNPFPSLPDHLDAVVYCVAADSRTEEAYRRAYVMGLKNILDQISIQGIPVKRFLFASSTAVYHQSKGESVDEFSDTQPVGFSGRIMLEAEQVLMQNSFEYSCVRFGGIYGPGRMRFLQAVAKGEVRVCESFPQFTNRIHSDDCAGVLHHLLEVDALQNCYVAVDCAPVSKQEVSDWIAERLGVALPVRVSRDEIIGTANKRCINTRLLRSGYQFLYPDYRAGYADLIGF